MRDWISSDRVARLPSSEESSVELDSWFLQTWDSQFPLLEASGESDTDVERLLSIVIFRVSDTDSLSLADDSTDDDEMYVVRLCKEKIDIEVLIGF